MSWLADLVHASLLSPSVHLAVFLSSARDAVVPQLPSETPVIGASGALRSALPVTHAARCR